jgi:hypothetical protein
MDGARRPDGRTHVDGGTQANRQDEIDWFFLSASHAAPRTDGSKKGRRKYPRDHVAAVAVAASFILSSFPAQTREREKKNMSPDASV